MMKRNLLFLLILVLAACQPAPSATSTPHIPTPTTISTAASVPTVTLSPGDTPTPEPSPTLMPITSLNSPTRYHLATVFNYNFHTLVVQEQITYTNPVDTPLGELVLVVEPARWPGAFTLTSLTWGDGSSINYTWDVQRMILALPQPLAPAETVALSVNYTLAIPPIPTDADRPVPFGYTLRQTNLVDWYPYIAPYAAGWLANTPGYFGEHQVYEMADFVVEIHLDAPPAGVTLAASAAARQDGTHYTYTVDTARNFVFSASAQYQVYTATATLADDRRITVEHYGSPFVTGMVPQVLSDTVRAVQIFSDLFVPYPHDHLSVAQADFLDGMEYDGLFFLSDGFYNTYRGAPDDYLTAIAVHETAHQWWYAVVGNDQSLEPWLDEALSTYSEVLYYEQVYPQALDDWWARRVNFYQPAGLINLPVFQYPGFIPYRDAVYLRGALFLQDLRQQIGDDAFFAFLKDYATRCSQKIARGSDFFTILAEHSQEDLSNLKQEYFAP